MIDARRLPDSAGTFATCWATPQRLLTASSTSVVARGPNGEVHERVAVPEGVAAIAADELGVAVACRDAQVRIFSPALDAPRLLEAGAPGLALELVAVRRGVVVAAYERGFVAVWDRASGNGTRVHHVRGGFLRGIDIPPGADRIAATTTDGRLHVLPLASEQRGVELELGFKGYENFGQAVTMVDPRTVVVAGRFKQVRRIDLEKRRTTHLFDVDRGGFLDAVSATADEVGVLAFDGALRVWQLSTRAIVDQSTSYGTAVGCSIAPDLRRAAFGTADGAAVLLVRS